MSIVIIWELIWNVIKCETGVPQGSKLGLILFNFYISDIPQTTKTNIAQFADDTTIYCDVSVTQTIIDALQKHFSVVPKMENTRKPYKKPSCTFYPT